jgi:CrcB protein
VLQYLLIGLGGFIGANSRYLLHQWVANQWGADFPYGTMLINVSGSLVIGFFLTLATGRLNISPEARLLVATGFLGGFTTFSSFSYETFQLVEQSDWWAAGIYFAGNTGLGLIAVVLGIFLARWLQGG